MALSEEDKKEIAEMIAAAMGNCWSNIQTKKLNCGIEIAMEDYREIDDDGNEKTEFTFDEALEIEKNTNGKWRLPTIAEWLQIVLELGTTKDGNYDIEGLVSTLKLTQEEFGYGCYWSSSISLSNCPYYVRYSPDEFYSTYYFGREGKRFVRCVKNVKAKGGKECEK